MLVSNIAPQTVPKYEYGCIAIIYQVSIKRYPNTISAQIANAKCKCPQDPPEARLSLGTVSRRAI